ncbi:MAG: hypothetical protein E7607_04220 [Ruminococcaceae bacterium]|nr:hypothetical protein [Oscillospiraceae bacterium]
MNIKRNYLIITAIAFLLFICLSVSVYQLTARLHQEQNLSYTASAETIYVYDTNNDVNSIEPSDKKWIIKEYNGIIGIFNSDDGALIQVIDTHIKTLPSKDQALLREGFEVFSKKELYSVIEAYSD